MCLNNVSFWIQKKLRHTNIHGLKPQTLDFKSKACFFELLIALQKTSHFHKLKDIYFPHVCLFWIFFFVTQRHEVFVLSLYIELRHGYLLEEEKTWGFCSFSLHRARTWLPTRGREVFVSIEWDNCSNKTIVNNNTLPPLPLQSSKLNSSGEMHFHVETMCLFISNS
jgi:hypothetical protein